MRIINYLKERARLVVLVAILLAEIAFLASVSFTLPGTNQFAAILSSTLIELANVSREGAKAPALKTNPLLEAAAKLKAEDMAKLGYFSHNGPGGSTPWYWLNLVGYDYSYAGENLAVNFTDSKNVNDAWMSSPSHRANILNGKYTEVGISTAKGRYKGKDATFVVQFFGRPAKGK